MCNLRILASVAVSAGVLLALPAAAPAARVPLSSAKAELARPLRAVAERPVVAVPRRTLDPASQATGKRAADRQYRASAGLFAPPGLPSAAIALNQPGLGPTNSSPPDSTGAIGPSHYVEMINGRVGAFSRAALAAVSSATLDAFTTRASSCDPQVL
jgi:hypothetical protein